MSTRASRPVLALLLAFAIFLYGLAAPAQPVAAVATLAEAERLFAAGDIGGAESRFRALLVHSRSPSSTCYLRWNLAHVVRRAGRAAEARQIATMCVADAPPSGCRDECAAMLAVLSTVEASPPAPEPAPRPAPEVTPDVARPVVVQPPRVLTRRPGGAHATGRFVPGAGPVALAVGGSVALAVGGVLGALHESALAGCEVQGSRAVCPDASTLARARGAPVIGASANVAVIVGGTALAAGVIWWLVGAAAPVVVVPSVSAESVGVCVGGRL